MLATSAVNRVLDFRRLVPGATRLSENFGQWSRRRFVARGFAATGGDRSYRRHDMLTAAVVMGDPLAH